MEKWDGIDVRGVQGTKPAGGNVPHIQNSAYYDAADGNADGLGQLKIVSVPGGFPDPPLELQADGYHQASKPIDTRTPQCSFTKPDGTSDGHCTVEGFDAAGDYYLVGDETGKPTGVAPGLKVARAAAVARLFAAAQDVIAVG